MNTILIVDDSATVREMVSEILKKSGLNVIEAINGDEAKKEIQKQVPDLVVTDIVMPEMNGYELCRWIKNTAEFQSIPVIMCTSKGEDFDRYWGMKQGADAYIAKPFRPTELLTTIKQLLKK
ncbi:MULTISPECIES: response regulator [Planktothricoides]|uniref:Response regulator n=2 Tax=Planktothricoides raciborskii TaxID=132608 RepID=A0AAU8JMH5_9CYAN|nr:MULTISPECIES: response regulator [Planktothricoides]KOR38254.1 chemotaxis protein CheY [Planktothricoides sp. SR001]MBD2543299.1 response regulator [Planktothricoides raciborskii FACHB-1370]MBD2581599.1 response regulator [Planktothricoides raciborskii FACHB-1261]